MPGPSWLTEQEQWIGQGLLDVMTKCCKHSTLGTHSAPEWSIRAAMNRKNPKTCAIKTQGKARNAPNRGLWVLDLCLYDIRELASATSCQSVSWIEWIEWTTLGACLSC